jgi:glycosyltransferase involved in cell wall biosynthesis
MRSDPWLIVSGVFAPNAGQDRANLALALHLASQGRETHVVAFRIAQELERYPNVVFHRVPSVMNRYAFAVPLLGLRGMLEARRLGGSGRVVVNGGNCLAPHAINWVHYVHAADRATNRVGLTRVRNTIARATERIALASAGVVLANSERTRRDLVQHVGVDDAKIRVVYLGVDADLFRPLTAGERDEARASLGWDARPRAVFVGALGDDRKGFDVVYAAWARLCRDRDWDADLIVCGGGKCLERWRARARVDGLESRVALLGFRTDVARVVAASDMMVACPRYEPYGLNVHEALSCAIPAITTAVSGVAERYPEALRAWIAPDPNDDVDLARRIARVRSALDRPNDALRSLSRELRARTWSKVAGEIREGVEQGWA